jgi:hypothetical protein
MSNKAALFVQAIRGPILLITIGLLFAAHQAGMISFARTWPLIIIVLGLMKLFERMLAPPTQPAYPGPTVPGAPSGGPPR